MSGRIRIGRLTLEPLPLPSRQVQPDTNAAPYLAALEELCRVLKPDNWALAGGLAVPISVGAFYRRHGDIDIVLPLAAIPEVVRAFNKAGYGLYTCWSISHHARGILMEYRIKRDGERVQARLRRLYAKPIDTRAAAPLLGKIDLYPYRPCGDGLQTCNPRRLLPRGMQRSSLEPFDRPGHVRCLHLDNVANLKAARSGPKHRLDCAVIRDGPDAAGDWFRARATPATAGALPGRA